MFKENHSDCVTENILLFNASVVKLQASWDYSSHHSGFPYNLTTSITKKKEITNKRQWNYKKNYYLMPEWENALW